MKKIILLSVVLFFAGLNLTMGQASLANLKPIPTYNYYMTEQNTAFVEPGTGETREKRDVNVVISNGGDAVGEDVFATIYVIKLDGSKIYGPYTVYSDEPFKLDLPKGKWGVTANCNWDVNVSVWISSKGRSLE